MNVCFQASVICTELRRRKSQPNSLFLLLFPHSWYFRFSSGIISLLSEDFPFLIPLEQFFWQQVLSAFLCLKMLIFTFTGYRIVDSQGFFSFKYLFNTHWIQQALRWLSWTRACSGLSSYDKKIYSKQTFKYIIFCTSTFPLKLSNWRSCYHKNKMFTYNNMRCWADTTQDHNLSLFLFIGFYPIINWNDLLTLLLQF